MSHAGPVQIRLSSKQGRYTVLCPLGHLVTGGALDRDFAGSSVAARISEHQTAMRHDRQYGRWIVECDGTV